MFKKYYKKLFFILSLSFFIISCNKDDNSNAEETPQFNDLGLQVGIGPINQDTLAIYNPNSIQIINPPVNTNDFETEYTIRVAVNNPDKLKKGSVIVDYTNGGAIWVVKEATKSSSKTSASKASSFLVMRVFRAPLDFLFKNAIVEIATPTNRVKEASANPKKLESGKFKLYSSSTPLLNRNLPSFSIKEQSVADGVTLSVDNNTVNVTLKNLKLYSNNSKTFNVTIPKGTLKVNNAFDMRFKYIPAKKLFFGTKLTIGGLESSDYAVYSAIDTDVELNIQSTTKGDVNLIDPIDEEIASYTKVIPIPPYFAASVKVSLKARLKVTANAELNVTPKISTKNNFEMIGSYKGINSLPKVDINYKNVETKLKNSVNGNFNLNQRFEIVPVIEVYAYGLLGPKGELIAFEEFNANATIQNEPLTWDAEIDLGVDYKASLDFSIFHIDKLSSSLISRSDNVFTYDLFTSPSTSELTEGNNQMGQLNTRLSSPIKVKIKNSRGDVVGGVPVFFETTNGNFTKNYISTDANGIATNYWVLGDNLGEQKAIAYVKNGKGAKIEATEVSIIATAQNVTTADPVGNPTPNNNAINIALNGNLSFTESANTPTNATFKVYFDTNPNPTTGYSLDANTNTLNYTNLQENTKYYWKVETLNSVGDVLATSPVWSFTTKNTQTAGGTTGEKVFVKGGTFMMGSPPNQGSDIERPQHLVTLNDFNISKYEVTNSEYVKFLNIKGNQVEGGKVWLDINNDNCQIEFKDNTFKVKKGKENYPVILVTWYGASAYAKWVGGRLPTEAEWEYAAKGGNKSKGYKYSGSNTLDLVAWYARNSTSQVGEKLANELGIHDMSGNVWEWCADWYGKYTSDSVENPTGPLTGDYRILRGGSIDDGWHNDNIDVIFQLFFRNNHSPNEGENTLGFRVAF